ncbi:alpha/beta hydrolase [Methylovirgula ligni]|uniref:Acetyl esterase/lipase n=1 Tax=Methylovirgula ligni TaxID=569860 RepID=A0A3D9Z3L2_9HYPH|nr:alpha/beta hydrolase [Methylovirgula ligni]QAY95747.1 alpha/beta hydrolase [Methylovirgula ligni]REF88878.1 acetyl esterase/lipase [Methylovirgula ligni]
MTDLLDPYARRLIDMLALQGGDAASLSIAERRAAFAGLMRLGGPGPEIRAVETGARNPRIRAYWPDGEATTALVFFHGGGLVAGDLGTHDALCRALAAASRCAIFAVDYRLAPENPFPAAVDDARAALIWTFANADQHGVSRIGIGGDSAGATLAAVAAAQWNARQTSKLAFQLLLCPIFDFAGQMQSSRLFQSPILDQATLDHDAMLYTAGHVPVSDPCVSPLRASEFAHLPPTFLHTAQCDPLRDEGAAYAEKLRAASVEVHHTCHAAMPHLFYALGSVIPYARKAVPEIGAELATWLARL